MCFNDEVSGPGKMPQFLLHFKSIPNSFALIILDFLFCCLSSDITCVSVCVPGLGTDTKLLASEMWTRFGIICRASWGWPPQCVVWTVTEGMFLPPPPKKTKNCHIKDFLCTSTALFHWLTLHMFFCLVGMDGWASDRWADTGVGGWWSWCVGGWIDGWLVRCMVRWAGLFVTEACFKLR